MGAVTVNKIADLRILLLDALAGNVAGQRAAEWPADLPHNVRCRGGQSSNVPALPG